VVVQKRSPIWRETRRLVRRKRHFRLNASARREEALELREKGEGETGENWKGENFLKKRQNGYNTGERLS